MFVTAVCVLFLLKIPIYFSFIASQVAVSLGIFAIEYPTLFGLCAFQLPLISGFLNPLLYGILWPPYRRAYIRALKWPGAKCCDRKSSSHTRSHTLDSKCLENVDVLCRPPINVGNFNFYLF